MARTRGPSCAEPVRRSSRLATKTTQAPKPLNTARGGPSTRGGRHAHVRTQRKVSYSASGVDRQPHSTLSPSQSSLSCPPTSPSASSPSRRPLPAPSCLPPTRDQPSSRASSSCYCDLTCCYCDLTCCYCDLTCCYCSTATLASSCIYTL